MYQNSGMCIYICITNLKAGARIEQSNKMHLLATNFCLVTLIFIAVIIFLCACFLRHSLSV